MKLIKTEDAVGQILCHDITQIIKGVTKDAVFRKGHVIREEDIPLMAMHADRECNPLYPVPMLLDRRELEAIYHELTCKEELRCALKAS